MKSRRIALWLVLGTSLLVPCVSASEGLQAIEGTEVTAGEVAKISGLILSEPEIRALDKLLADLQGKVKIADALYKEATASMAVEQAKLRESELRTAAAEAALAVERARRPTFIENHVGVCLGVGTTWDGTDVTGGITLAAGWKF